MLNKIVCDKFLKDFIWRGILNIPYKIRHSRGIGGAVGFVVFDHVGGL
jgi:hypothetical protein